LSGKFEVLTGKSLAWSETLICAKQKMCAKQKISVLNKKYFNWKFSADYGTSYFINCQTMVDKKSFVISFGFIPFLRNNFKCHVKL